MLCYKSDNKHGVQRNIYLRKDGNQNNQQEGNNNEEEDD
jgi:hypothetical protein